MNLKESVQLPKGGGAIVAGLAQLAYVRKLLEDGGYQVFAAQAIGTEPALLVQQYAPLRLTYLDRIRESGENELDIVVAPRGMEIAEADLQEAVGVLDQYRRERKRSDEGNATAVYATAILLYRACRTLISQAAQVPNNDGHVDPVTLRAVAAIGDAVEELRIPISRAVRDLENGDGGIFRAFDTIPQPDEEEARIAILVALKAVLSCFFYNRSIRSLGYEQLEQFPLFTVADMERIFVGAFLSPIGTWEGQGLEGHEDRSARYVELICSQNANVPDVVELVRAHGHTEWINRYVYRIMVLGEAHDAEAVHPIHFGYQRDNVPGRESEIQRSYAELIRSLPRPSHAARDPNSIEVSVEQMPPTFTRDVLAVALADAFITRTEILGDAPEQVIEDLTDSYRAVCEPRSPVGNGSSVPTPFGVALAALANTLDVIPERAVVELREDGTPTRAARLLGLSGGRAVCLSRPSENAPEACGPYLWLFGHRNLPAGQFLKMPVGPRPSIAELVRFQTGEDGLPKRCFIPLGGQTHKRVYRRKRRIVLWVMDAESYRHYFSVPLRLLPTAQQLLRGRSGP